MKDRSHHYQILEMAPAVAFVATRLESLRLGIKPGSRLDIGRRLLTEVAARTRGAWPPEAGLSAVLEAQRDFTMFDFILREWPYSNVSGDSHGRLRMALRDHPNPAKHRGNTPGRDTQFELFVAVAIARSGLPVDLMTPDVRTRLEGGYFFVEAKRPKSADAIAECVKKASEQIRRTGCPGAILVDITLAANPANALVPEIVDDLTFQAAHDSFIDQLMMPMDTEIQECLREANIPILMVLDHRVRRTEGNFWQLEGNTRYFENRTASTAAARLGQRLIDSLWHGMKPRMHS